MSKPEREITKAKEKAELLAVIKNSAKPPEKSVFSRHWKIFGTAAAITAVAITATIIASSKNKNGSPK